MSDLSESLRIAADLTLKGHRLAIVLNPGPESEDGVIAYLGETVDHLYPNCPALRGRTLRQTCDLVDPHGTDLCGWCQRVWKTRHKETP